MAFVRLAVLRVGKRDEDALEISIVGGRDQGTKVRIVQSPWVGLRRMRVDDQASRHRWLERRAVWLEHVKHRSEASSRGRIVVRAHDPRSAGITAGGEHGS
jgi:hypothetical protein